MTAITTESVTAEITEGAAVAVPAARKPRAKSATRKPLAKPRAKSATLTGDAKSASDAVVTAATEVATVRARIGRNLKAQEALRADVRKRALHAKSVKAVVTTVADEIKIARLAIYGASDALKSGKGDLKAIDDLAKRAHGAAELGDVALELAKSRAALQRKATEKRRAEVKWDVSRESISDARIKVAACEATILHDRAAVADGLADLTTLKARLAALATK